MEFKEYIKISFAFEGKRYERVIKKSELVLDEDPDTWFGYFDDGKFHFEVWGGYDDEGNPATGGFRKDNSTIPFAVNCYEVTDGYSEWIDQVDDIDIIECK